MNILCRLCRHNSSVLAMELHLFCIKHQYQPHTARALFQYKDCLSRHIDSLQWCHNEHDGISNHQHLDCFLNHLFRRRSKKTSKLCTGLCEGNPPVTSGFPSQRASNVEKHLYIEMIPWFLSSKSMDFNWLHGSMLRKFIKYKTFLSLSKTILHKND